MTSQVATQLPDRLPVAARATALVDTRLSGTDAPQADGTLARSQHENSRFELINGYESRAFWRRQHRRSPAYIQRCVANPHRTQSPYLGYRWKRGTDFVSLSRCPKACGSHKCPSPDCRKYASNLLWSRLNEAFQRVEAKDLVFLVFTLPSHWHRPGQDPAARYAATHRARYLFVKRLRKWLVERYGYQFESKNFWAVEEHRSGVPHLNFVFEHHELGCELRARKEGLQAAGYTAQEAIRMQGDLARIAEESGFGRVCTAEANRGGDDGAEKLAGYLTKTVQGLAGEQQKGTQLPLNSPYRRRTWGAGKGFVPPKRTNPEWTGGVIRRSVAREGDEVAETMLRDQIPEPEYLLRVQGLAPDNPVRLEAERRWAAELEQKRRYRENMAFVAQIEQQLAYEDEDRRWQKLPLKLTQSLSFHVREDGVYDSEGRRVLATHRPRGDTQGHGQKTITSVHRERERHCCREHTRNPRPPPELRSQAQPSPEQPAQQVIRW